MFNLPNDKWSKNWGIYYKKINRLRLENNSIGTIYLVFSINKKYILAGEKLKLINTVELFLLKKTCEECLITVKQNFTTFII